jgi:hypothetical protein
MTKTFQLTSTLYVGVIFLIRRCRLKYILAQHFKTLVLMFLYWLMD